ncbi:MAG: adenosylcobinamide-phosphate synthase CbiB [Chloroflexota bacterium]
MFKLFAILFAVILDLVLGDPPNRFHPVVWMGNWLTFGRKNGPTRRRFQFGLRWTLVGMALFTLPISILFNRFAWLQVLSPFFLKPMFAYRNLRGAALSIKQALEADDLAEARRLLSWHLVSRDTSQLSEAEVIGATLESLAENLTDSLTAPLMAYSMGGLPAAWAYRFVNTADAMWGYRNAEFEQLGKFPAKLDDALNWLPARLTGWLLVIAAWITGADARNAATTMLTQHQQTPSPNAGWTMSAMAGACDTTLDKRDTYILRGGSQNPDLTILEQALRIADWTAGLVIIMACLFALMASFTAKRKR